MTLPADNGCSSAAAVRCAGCAVEHTVGGVYGQDFP